MKDLANIFSGVVIFLSGVAVVFDTELATYFAIVAIFGRLVAMQQDD